MGWEERRERNGGGLKNLSLLPVFFNFKFKQTLGRGERGFQRRGEHAEREKLSSTFHTASSYLFFPLLLLQPFLGRLPSGGGVFILPPFPPSPPDRTRLPCHIELSPPSHSSPASFPSCPAAAAAPSFWGGALSVWDLVSCGREKEGQERKVGRGGGGRGSNVSLLLVLWAGRSTPSSHHHLFVRPRLRDGRARLRGGWIIWTFSRGGGGRIPSFHLITRRRLGFPPPYGQTAGHSRRSKEEKYTKRESEQDGWWEKEGGGEEKPPFHCNSVYGTPLPPPST